MSLAGQPPINRLRLSRNNVLRQLALVGLEGAKGDYGKERLIEHSGSAKFIQLTAAAVD